MEAIKPLQKKMAQQQHDINESGFQTSKVDNNVEKVIEMWLSIALCPNFSNSAKHKHFFAIYKVVFRISSILIIVHAQKNRWMETHLLCAIKILAGASPAYIIVQSFCFVTS